MSQACQKRRNFSRERSIFKTHDDADKLIVDPAMLLESVLPECRNMGLASCKRDVDSQILTIEAASATFAAIVTFLLKDIANCQLL